MQNDPPESAGKHQGVGIQLNKRGLANMLNNNVSSEVWQALPLPLAPLSSARRSATRLGVRPYSKCSKHQGF